MDRVDITGLDKAEVLLALYNASHLGMRYLRGVKSGRLTIDDAKKILGRCTYSDYVRGRIIKVSLEGDTFNPRLYDGDNGEGAAQRAIDSLR